MSKWKWGRYSRETYPIYSSHQLVVRLLCSPFARLYCNDKDRREVEGRARTREAEETALGKENQDKNMHIWGRNSKIPHCAEGQGQVEMKA